MSAKDKIAAAIAVGALLLMANEASAQYRADSRIHVPHLPRAFERAYGFVPRQVPQFSPGSDPFYSNSLGRQPFPNPDRDYSIQNLRSHPSG